MVSFFGANDGSFFGIFWDFCLFILVRRVLGAGVVLYIVVGGIVVRGGGEGEGSGVKGVEFWWKSRSGFLRGWFY